MKTIFRFYVVCLFLFQSTLAVYSQQPTFTKVIYDPSGSVQAYSMVKTMDQNYMIAGEKDNKALVMKMDSSGTILWSKTIGNTTGAFYTLTSTRDSCFVMAGFAYNPEIQVYFFCVKMNTNGDTLWTRTINMGLNAKIFSLKQTLDNGFILVGDSAQIKIVVVKLNAAGNLTWGKIITGGNLMNYAYGVEQTPDSGYIVTGSVENYPADDAGMFLMKLTSTGSVSWSKRQVFTGQNYSIGYDVRIVPGGIITYYASQDSGLIVMKTDLSGNVLWSKYYDILGTGSYNISPKLHQTSDSGYIFVCGSPFGPNSMLKADINGTLLWHQDLVLNAIEAVESGDRGYMVIGNGPLLGVIMTGTTNPQVGIIKTDSLGNSAPCTNTWSITSGNYTVNLQAVTFTPVAGGSVSHMTFPVANAIMTIDSGCVLQEGGIKENNPDAMTITVFPNPTDGVFRVTVNGTSSNEMKSVEVLNLLGEKIYGSNNPAILLSPIDIGYVPDGIYYIKLVCRRNTYIQKVVVFH